MATSRHLAGTPLPYETGTSADQTQRGLLASLALPVRSRPLPDELISSWLIRLAWLNAEKLYTFKKRFWPHKGSPWGRNLDLVLSADDLAMVAEMSLVSRESLVEHTLWPYLGRLFEHADTNGCAQGLLVGRRRGQKVLGFGLQLCPTCIKVTPTAYFRRWWKVAYFVACPFHGQLLIDACPQCGQPLAYHLADFGKSLLPERLPTEFCAGCGYRWGSYTLKHDELVSDDFAKWQGRLLDALETGWIEDEQNGWLSALSFFEGLRVLIRLIIASDHSMQLRQVVAREIEVLPLGVVRTGSRNLFGGLRLGDRYYVLRYVFWLLGEWPERFIWACKTAKLSFSYIDYCCYRTTLPYWIASAATFTRDHRHCRVSAEEQESVKRFLQERGVRASANQVNRWMGRWYVSRHREAK